MDKIKEILEVYGNQMDDEQKFQHIMKQIDKHIPKITNLKANEDRPGHFKEEVADIHILTSALVELEKVDKDTMDAALEHFLDTIKKIYCQPK
ncbi:hypothetical protein KY362_04405 [Candidatus Woesearchaeota archaeon]|nr:hypothetical protein [Candidatus Woesearchaeota archaeon]